MLILVGISGSLMMLTSFACIKFMPVSDATTLMFTSPLFTIILSAVFMKERLTYLKALIGKYEWYKGARFNFKIPPHLKKGHLFYNIMDTWNNSSEYIKKIIVDEKRPGKNFSRKIKARIKDYINSKYPICTMTDCYACAHTYI